METLNELLEGLMRDQLIKEYQSFHSHEVVGVEPGDIYVYMIHDTRVYDDPRFMQLCDSAKTVSEYCLDGDYETQLIINQ